MHVELCVSINHIFLSPDFAYDSFMNNAFAMPGHLINVVFCRVTFFAMIQLWCSIAADRRDHRPQLFAWPHVDSEKWCNRYHKHWAKVAEPQNGLTSNPSFALRRHFHVVNMLMRRVALLFGISLLVSPNHTAEIWPNCTVAPHRDPPATISDLRLGDFKVVMAMGDSMTGGFNSVHGDMKVGFAVQITAAA